MEFLPRPEVLGCFFDDCVVPHLSAMELRWHADAPGTAERVWHLPQGVSVHGPAPERFGIAIERLGEDDYKVQVLWNHLCLAWNHLRRVQIMTSSLSLVLQALGTDMWHLLHQPIPQALAA
jgi:hypothetical protein